MSNAKIPSIWNFPTLALCVGPKAHNAWHEQARLG